LCAGRPAAHWFTAASTSGGCFPSPSVTDPTDRSPTLSNRVHSLVPSVLFGVPSPALPVRLTRRDTRVSNRGERAAPARISSLIATSPAASTIPLRGTRGFRSPLRSVLGLSQPPDGFLHHRLRGLVSSRSHVQGSCSVQGILPIRSMRRLVAVACLHAVPTRALTGKPAAMRAPVDLEAFLRESMRSANSAVKPHPRPLPSSGSPGQITILLGFPEGVIGNTSPSPRVVAPTRVVRPLSRYFV